MKIAGIIAEYNPFHNGHKYQLDEVKKQYGGVIAIMSGHFVQRGGIAVTDKWTRARAAVTNGCDLVLELPVCYSLNSAQNFAYGAVSLLDSLNIADALCFGSECADIDALSDAARAIINEPPEISLKIKKYINDGLSYPSAYEKAYEGIISADILSMPNNILAIEYIKALFKLNSSITPVTIARTGAEHNSCTADGGFASASFIRNLIANKMDYSEFVPKSAYEIYNHSDLPYDISALDSFITATLRCCPLSEIKNTYDIEEGLENRIRSAAMNSCGFHELCEKVKTKRYTMSRIRRVILSAVLMLPPAEKISYARVLAANDTGREILKQIKQKSDITIITKTADYKKPDKMFLSDIAATDIFSLCSPNPDTRCGGRDFTTSPFFIGC